MLPVLPAEFQGAPLNKENEPSCQNHHGSVGIDLRKVVSKSMYPCEDLQKRQTQGRAQKPGHALLNSHLDRQHFPGKSNDHRGENEEAQIKANTDQQRRGLAV